MQPQDIHLADWHRLLFGDAPPSLLIELVIRAAALFLLLVAAMRILGGRMASRLTRTELAAVVSLAAAVGVPLMTLDRGLIPALIIAIVVVIAVAWLGRLTLAKPELETTVEGDLAVLVADSHLCVDAMEHARITREQVFARLRAQGLKHLGTVKRLFLEANGTFTTVSEPTPRPGLSIVPEWDPDFARRQRFRSDVLVCANCGLGCMSERGDENQPCAQCRGCVMIPAIE
jgi:hypothetical protein